MIKIVKEKLADADEVEVLLDLVFGLGRETLGSYRLRDGVKRIDELCYTLRDDFGVLVGVIRFWPVFLGSQKHKALLLGPLGVHPTRQGEGLGKLLIDTSINKAKEIGWTRVILIGDLAYYKQFGFSKKFVKNIFLNDKNSSFRILGRELILGSMSDLKGPIFRYAGGITYHK